MKIFIVERRSNHNTNNIEDQDCYLGTTIDKCETFIKNNTDFDTDRTYLWWWVILCQYVDYDMFNDKNADVNPDDIGIVKILDWDGNEINNQPFVNRINK